MNKHLSFKDGIIDALPICLGYISVAIAFGVLAVQNGLPLWAPPLISVTSLSGTGQFAALDLLKATASYIEIFCAILVINARYFLMSVSLSQLIPPDLKWWQKCIIAFGNTDEVFAVATGKRLPLNFKYMSGLILCAFFGWTTGTVIGTFAGSIVPEVLSSAFGISLYAMFLAIIIPTAIESNPITFTIILSAVLSIAFYYTPYLNRLSSGWVIIICGLGASVISAIKFPVREADDE